MTTTAQTTHLTSRRTARATATRVLAILAGVLLASAMLVVGAASSPAFAATTAQCNGEFEGGGQGANCQVTIENSLNLATGEESSTVTTLVCNGGANTVTTCAGPGTVVTNDFLTDVVDQCNGSVNGGGGTLHCSVVMTNTIIGAGETSVASVNQCNGSFDSLPLPEDSACDPVASTTDATITQCNGSMNGGTQVSMNCTVDASTVSSAMPVSIDQCNDSVNGGGSLLVCSTSITTLFVPAETGGGTDEGGEGGGSGTEEGGSGTDTLPVTGPTTTPLLLGGLGTILLGALVLATVAIRNQRIPSRA